MWLSLTYEISDAFDLRSACEFFRSPFDSIVAYMNEPVSPLVEKHLNAPFGTMQFWLGKRNEFGLCNCSLAHSRHFVFISAERTGLLWGAGSRERWISSQHSIRRKHSQGEAWYCQPHLKSCFKIKNNRLFCSNIILFFKLCSFILINKKHRFLKTLVFNLYNGPSFLLFLNAKEVTTSNIYSIN